MSAHRQHPGAPKATPIVDALYVLGAFLVAIACGALLAWRG